MKRSLKIFSIAIAVAATVALVTSASSAQRGMRRDKAQASIAGVQLSAEQERRVAAIRQETQQRVQSAQNNQSLSQQEKASRSAEARRKGHQNVLAALTPEQRRQFEERWQAGLRPGKAGKSGMRAGAGPKMQGQGSLGADIGQGVPGVKLTPEQKEITADIRDETRSRIQSIRGDDSLTREEQERRIVEARRKGHENVLAALTSEQRRQFEERLSNRSGAGKGPQNDQGSQQMRGGGFPGKTKH